MNTIAEKRAYESHCYSANSTASKTPKSATASRALGLRKTPRRGRSHALLVIADFIKKNFGFVIRLSNNSLHSQIVAIIFDLIGIRSLCFDQQLSNISFSSILRVWPNLVIGTLSVDTAQPNCNS